MAGHALDIRVYYEDTDAGGVVYHANYLKFFERARSELIRENGVDQQKLLDEDGLAFVVRRCAVEYRAPARLGDLLTIRTRLAASTAATLTLTQWATLGDKTIAEAEVMIVLIDRNGRPQRVPRAVESLLRAAGAAAGA